MSESFERVIRDLLLMEKDPVRVGERLLKRLHDDDIRRVPKKVFLNYLTHAGFYEEAHQVFFHLFKMKQSVPWSEFLNFLNKSGFKPNKGFIDKVLAAQRSTHPKDRLNHFIAWEKYDERLQELRENYYQETLKEQKAQKEELFEKLEYFRTNRMTNEEKKILDLLEKTYPKDEKIKSLKKDFQLRWAHEVIANKTRFQVEKELGNKKNAYLLNEEERNFADEFTESLKIVIQDVPETAYDLTIGLCFLEYFQKAIELLEFSEEGPSKDWLRLDLLHKAKRFIECLDYIVSVENKYSDDPESTFAGTYLRAQVLFGLGQKNTAIELMKSIVEIRPSYRAAHSLLMEWHSD